MSQWNDPRLQNYGTPGYNDNQQQPFSQANYPVPNYQQQPIQQQQADMQPYQSSMPPGQQRKWSSPMNQQPLMGSANQQYPYDPTAQQHQQQQQQQYQGHMGQHRQSGIGEMNPASHATFHHPDMNPDKMIEIASTFKAFDSNNIGIIDSNNIIECLMKNGILFDNNEIRKTIDLMDNNGDGKVSWDEYYNFMVKVYTGCQPGIKSIFR